MPINLNYGPYMHAWYTNESRRVEPSILYLVDYTKPFGHRLSFLYCSYILP